MSRDRAWRRAVTKARILRGPERRPKAAKDLRGSGVDRSAKRIRKDNFYGEDISNVYHSSDN